MSRPHLPRLSADDRAFWLAYFGLLASVVFVVLLVVYLSNAARWSL
ncbi:hypothetical protein [Nocardia cyriacigeorgica]|nr:hypothetical protein [Nocardia cyriacigeorgica]